MATSKATHSMSVELKRLFFDVEYSIIDGYFDRELNEYFQAEIHLESIKSQGDEMDMTYHEEEEIREYIKEHHSFQ